MLYQIWVSKELCHYSGTYYPFNLVASPFPKALESSTRSCSAGKTRECAKSIAQDVLIGQAGSGKYHPTHIHGPEIGNMTPCQGRLVSEVCLLS